MPLFGLQGALLFVLSVWGMQMQASGAVRIFSNETCAGHNFYGDEQTYDAHNTSNRNLRISQFTLQPNVDYCNQQSENFACERKERVWTFGEELGGGTFGVVFKVTAGSDEGALKVAAENSNRAFRQENCQSIQDEKNNLDEIEKKLKAMGIYDSKCDNYLMHIIDATPCRLEHGMRTPLRNSFLMETMSGDLVSYQRWATRNLSPEDQEKCMKFVIDRVIQGLQCMHMAGWAHLDIKGGNILLRWAKEEAACPTEVRLTDFGEAAMIGQSKNGKYPGGAADAWYMPSALFSHGKIIVSGQFDWCMFAFAFISYPDAMVKGHWDDYWGGDCGKFGPGRQIPVVLTEPKPELPKRQAVAKDLGGEAVRPTS